MQYEVIFQALVTYLCKTFEKLRKYSLKAPEMKKKNKQIQPRNTQELGKKKVSNAKNLRKIEPQPEQTFLIKKNYETYNNERKETCFCKFKQVSDRNVRKQVTCT